MVANNILAIKSNFVMMGKQHSLLDHPDIKYFTKSMQINHPLSITQRNIMSLDTLAKLFDLFDTIPSSYTIKAIFLMAFFSFMRISNLVPYLQSPERDIELFSLHFFYLVTTR